MISPKYLLTYLIATQIACSVSAHADVMIKLETRVSVPGGASAASGSKGISTYYVRGEARRHDTVSPLGSHTAVIRHCDTGAGYFVDFDRKEYYKLTASTRPSGGHLGKEEGRSKTPGAPGGPAVTVTAETVEVGDSQKILGHFARHFVTRVKESIPDPAGANQEPTEVIDGWYLTDVREPATNCTSEAMMDQPSVWIGAPVLPTDGAEIQYQHTGPTPRGLAVRVRRTSGHGDRPPTSGMQESATVLDREVIDFSDTALDQALFEVPKEFREVARPSLESGRLPRP
jgi:hypothetical protein